MQRSILAAVAILSVFALFVNVSFDQIRHVDPPIVADRHDRIRYRLRTNWKMGQRQPEELGMLYRSNIN